MAALLGILLQALTVVLAMRSSSVCGWGWLAVDRTVSVLSTVVRIRVFLSQACTLEALHWHPYRLCIRVFLPPACGIEV